MWRRTLLALPVASLICSPGYAAEPNEKVPVFVNFTGDDPLGKQFAFFFREELRGSSTFSEADSAEDTAFVIYLETIDPDVNDSGQSTAYSYVETLKDGYFLTSSVGICGSARLRDCATELLGKIGADLEDIRKALAADAESSQ